MCRFWPLFNNHNSIRRDFEKKVTSLEGNRIGDIASTGSLSKLEEQWNAVQSGQRKYMEKNIINDIIENDYFEVPKNSSDEPDIVLEDGQMFELKVSHLFLARGLVRPKYRLVLKVLNYLEMEKHSDWRDSPLFKKLKQMVIVFYYKDEGKPPWDWIVTNSFIWHSADYNNEIQKDYNLTRNRVLAGQKISESDTNLLANCPKHNSKFCWWCHVGAKCNNPKKSHPAPHPVLNGSLRPHTALGSAEKRGYCIPAQRMAKVFSDEVGIDLERRGGGSKPSYGIPKEKVPHL